MIGKLIKWFFGDTTPSTTDCFIYATVALLNGFAAGLGSDEAAKWISGEWLFWLRILSYTGAQTMLAIKMFRSTGYADDKKRQDAIVTTSSQTTETIEKKEP